MDKLDLILQNQQRQDQKLDTLTEHVTQLREFRAEVRAQAKASSRWTSTLISLAIGVGSILISLLTGHKPHIPLE